jgi:hypothetical protein
MVNTSGDMAYSQQVKRVYKRHLLLKRFSEVMFAHDPMGLGRMGAPSDEYDNEALSVLARFNESMLHGLPDDDPQDTALTIAEGLIQQAFTFWFNEPLVDEAATRELARELLSAYQSSVQRPRNVRRRRHD